MLPRLARHISFLRSEAEQAGEGLPSLIWKAEQATQNILSGEHALKKPGAGEQYWQFREYDVSDRPQDIDWRQTAKGDPVFVKEHEKQSPQKTLLWCANNAGMDYKSDAALPTKKEAGSILGLALAILLTKSHEMIGGIESKFKAGHSDKAIERLAENFYDSGVSSLDALKDIETDNKANLVFISDFLDDLNDIENLIQDKAQNRQGLILQVLDPAEITLPFDGRAIFEMADHAEKETIENVADVRAKYQERIQTHINAIKKITLKAGWHYHMHCSDKPVSESLQKIWIMLGGEK